eukprot:6759885-Prymnesium_polylepis.1
MSPGAVSGRYARPAVPLARGTLRWPMADDVARRRCPVATRALRCHPPLYKPSESRLIYPGGRV